MQSHGHSQSLASLCRLCVNCKQNASDSKDSAGTCEMITKYIIPNTKAKVGDDISADESNFEEYLRDTATGSPYKNLFREIKYSSKNLPINEENDFRTPKRINKVTFKLPQDKAGHGSNASTCSKTRARRVTAAKNCSRTRKSKRSKQLLLTKILKDNVESVDTNPEHLQMAVALSRSVMKNNVSESKHKKKDVTSTSQLYPSTQQKLTTVKETLEQFCFKINKSKTNVQHHHLLMEKKRKKRKYQYITPVLLLRTQTDRERILSDKVAQILSHNLQKDLKFIDSNPKEKVKPISETLQKYWSHGNRIFGVSSSELEILNSTDMYYVKSLNVPKTKGACGVLLKDWRKIPGREASPIRILKEAAVGCAETQINITTQKEQHIKQTSIRAVILDNEQSNSLDLDTAAPNDDNSLSTALRNNIQIQSFSSRSISPDLFDSDDEMVLEVPVKGLEPEKLSNTPEFKHYCSESLLKLTPIKSKFGQNSSSPNSLINPNKTITVDPGSACYSRVPATDSQQEELNSSDFEMHCSHSAMRPLPLNKCKKTTSSCNLYLDADETLESISLLNVGAPKHCSSKSVDVEENNSPSFQTRVDKTPSGNKYRIPDLSDDDLFENEKGICLFENFHAENDYLSQKYFHLVHSFGDDNNKEGINVVLDLTNSSSEDMECSSSNNAEKQKQSADVINNISHLISPTGNIKPTSLVMSVCESAWESPVSSTEHLIVAGGNEFAETRRSRPINVTEHIRKMLDEEQESAVNSFTHADTSIHEKLATYSNDINEVFDLTNTSSDFSCTDYHISDKCISSADGISNPVSKVKSQEKISTSGAHSILSPTRFNRNKINEENSGLLFKRYDSFKSTTSTTYADDTSLSQISQESICISDEELNYSSVHGTPCWNVNKKSKFPVENHLQEISDDESCKNTTDCNSSNVINIHQTPTTSKDISKFLDRSNNSKFSSYLDDFSSEHFTMFNSNQASSRFGNDERVLQHARISNLSSENTPTGLKSKQSLFNSSFNVASENADVPVDIKNAVADSSTPKQAAAKTPDCGTSESNITPKHDVIIKTSSVTPMANYNEMNTPKITKELQKFGVKPMKRQRGVQILRHIYESTHPLVSQTTQSSQKSESDEEQRIVKKRKSITNVKSRKNKSPIKSEMPSNVQPSTENQVKNVVAELVQQVSTGYMSLDIGEERQIEIVGNLMSEKETVDDLIFERKCSAKILSCRLPLHIAWHNLVSSHPTLQESILLYKPLSLEALYTILKKQGYKYHIQDLLTFLDKKCITIRTNQSKSRKEQQQRKSVTPTKKI